MASPANKSAGYGVRLSCICIFGLLSAVLASAQQYPFLPISAPNAPPGCMFPFEDRSGGLWLAGCEAGSEGLYFFDGSRFIQPLKDQFPKVIVRGLAEDTDGAIWISSREAFTFSTRGRFRRNSTASLWQESPRSLRTYFLQLWPSPPPTRCTTLP